MKLTIKEFWQKVEPDDTQPFRTRVLPEYELRSTMSYPNAGGWESREEWRKAVTQKIGFQGFDSAGFAKFDRGSHYGIHSYQLVGLE